MKTTIAALALVAGLVTGCSTSDEPAGQAGGADEPQDADQHLGFEACRDLIDVRLESGGITDPVYPDPYEDDGEVEFEVDGDQVTVRSTFEVDGGAKSDFTCTVEDDGDDGWHLVELDLFGAEESSVEEVSPACQGAVNDLGDLTALSACRTFEEFYAALDASQGASEYDAARAARALCKLGTNTPEDWANEPHPMCRGAAEVLGES